MKLEDSKNKFSFLFKSPAAALLFSACLGPVGLLYSSLTGGIVMIVIAFIVVSCKFIVPIIITWLITCIWSIAATNRHNKKMLNLLLQQK